MHHEEQYKEHSISAETYPIRKATGGVTRSMMGYARVPRSPAPIESVGACWGPLKRKQKLTTTKPLHRSCELPITRLTRFRRGARILLVKPRVIVLLSVAACSDIGSGMFT